ncbi:MAG: HEAT repeat domain-containing protein [Ignavibacteria bacterium]|nr:HEAT repeat domain-containing protein [Ignavibacteria bacterium]
MNLERFSESAYLYLLDEMEAGERIEFENILMQDDVLKREFDKIKADIALFEEAKPAVVTEAELTSIRNNLSRAIRNQDAVQMPEGLKNKIRRIFLNNYSLAFGGIATFVLGIGIGYMVFFSKGVTDSIRPEAPIEIGSLQKAEVMDESKTALLESGSRETEKSTESKSTIIRGSFNEASVKHALITALLGQSNPGIRIKSISTISEHAKEETFKPDLKIKKALITALKKDDNPAVRKGALIVLQKYPYDEEMRDAMLYILANDTNSGMRVAAINALADWNQQKQILDEVLKQALTKNSKADRNTFVQIRAASILKEVE